MFSVREVPVRGDVHAYHVLSVDQYLLVMEMVILSSTSTPPGGRRGAVILLHASLCE